MPMIPSGPGRAVPLRVRRTPHPASTAGLALASMVGFAMLLSRDACAVLPPILGGPLPAMVVEAIASGLIRPAPPPLVPDEAPWTTPLDPRLARPTVHAAMPATIGHWNLPVLLVDFPDRRATHAAALFQPLLFDTTGTVPTGSLANYYDEVSGGLLKVRGRVLGWRTLADTANFYANDSYGLARTTYPQNDAGLLYAALRANDADIDFTQHDRNADGYVDGVLVVHAGVGAEAAAGDRTQFWSVTSGLNNNWGFVSSYVTDDPRPGFPGQFMKVDQFAILPENSPLDGTSLTEIGVYAHEFGHILGWPDLYDATVLGGGTNLGPGNWCLMSTGAYGGDNRSPARPTHPSAWAKVDAGWAQVENLATDGDATFQPMATAHRAYRLWFQGEDSPEFFLLENRRRTGFDSSLPGEGLLAYRIRSDVIAQRRYANNINSGLIPGLRLEEADGRYDLTRAGNRGDGRDPFPGAQNRTRFADDTVPSTRTLQGRPLNTSLEAIRTKGADISAYVQLSPSGWSAPQTIGVTGPTAALVATGRSPLVADALGDLWLAYEDDAPGGNEIRIRRKRFGVEWSPPLALTNEPGLSLSPALAIGAAGRKAVAWWDTRDGNSEIYYAWAEPGADFGAARRATNQPAASQLPAVAWTSAGRIVLAWMDGRDGGTAIYTRRFFPGEESAATDVRASFPEEFAEFGNAALPTVATAGSRIVLAYQERIDGVDEIKVCVDSAGGFTETRFLSARDGFTSNQPVLVTESDTSVWLFWRENRASESEIRQARWSLLAGWNLGFDVYRSAVNLDLPRPVVDARGNIKLNFRRSTSDGLELVEATWHRDLGLWDAGPSRLLSFGAEQLLGTGFALDSFGRTHLAWLSSSAGARRLRTIVRAAAAAAPVAVDPPPAVPASAGLAWAWPNPAHGRAEVHVALGGRSGDGLTATLYSVAGRRLATLPVRGEGEGRTAWDGRDDTGRSVPPGVVLVHVADRAGASVARGRFVWLP